MAVVSAFVSTPATTPTVTLNLVQPGLVKVLADSFSLGATEFDGDPESGLGDYLRRQVSFTLQITGTYQQAAAFTQQLARIVAQGRRSWLMLRWSAGDDPMFARVYPSSMDALEMRSAGVEVWHLPLALTCEGGLYGAPQSGSVSINNDPANATNPCFWNIGSSVLGDLETPLFITTGAQTDLSTRYLMIGSNSLAYGLTQTSPYIFQLNAAGITTATNGNGAWTTGTGDAAMSGGNYYRFTANANGVVNSGTLTWNAGTVVLSGAPIGDYRVLLRYRTSAPADHWTVTLSQLTANGAVNGATTAFSSASTSLMPAGWLDLGVFRFPSGSPVYDTEFATTPASAGQRVSVNVSVQPGSFTVGDTFDVDVLMFVPAGVDQAAASHLAIAQVPSTLGSGVSAQAVFDGVSQSFFLLNSSGQLAASAIATFAGSMPTVVPGCHNSVTFLRTLNNPAFTGSDAITTSTTLNWQYWPRYLHLKPSGS